MTYVIRALVLYEYYTDSQLLVSGSIDAKDEQEDKPQDPLNRLGGGIGNANASHHDHGSFDKEFDPRTLTRAEAEMRKDMNVSRTERMSKKDARHKTEILPSVKGATEKKIVPNKPAGVNVDLDNINPSNISLQNIAYDSFMD